MTLNVSAKNRKVFAVHLNHLANQVKRQLEPAQLAIMRFYLKY